MNNESAGTTTIDPIKKILEERSLRDSFVEAYGDITELQKGSLRFGWEMMQSWLKNEQSFVDNLKMNWPMQFCFGSVYKTLVQIGELPKWEDSFLEDAEGAAGLVMQWFDHPVESNTLKKLTQVVMCLNAIAEKKLKLTSGL